MIRKLFITISLTTILLSACGGQAPAEIPTPASTETPAATEMPAGTDTPTGTPTETSTPETPIPTNAPGCTNSAAFVIDVTIPDNQVVAAASSFTKTWRVRNTGTCIWGPDYTIAHYSDERMGAPASAPLSLTLPGEELDISLNMVAANNVGTHRGNFVIKNPEGLIMSIDEDSRLWVIINVTSTVTLTPSLSPTPSSAGGTANPTATGSTATAGASGTGSSSVPAACDVDTDRARLTNLVNAVNAYRAQNGLPAYTVNSLLSQAAQTHANDMACNKLFVHTGSDGSTPRSRVAATGYTGSSVSENVYGSFPPLTAQGVLNWWINDKTDVRHGQNLLSTSFMDIGVGYAFFDNYGYYVMVFGRP